MVQLIKKNKFLLFVFLFAGLFFLLYFLSKRESIPLLKLPFYGKTKPINGDTIRHRLPDFSFVNQNGETFTKQQLKNKIFVADYFFTTCGSICPIMKKQMKRVFDTFLNDSEIIFLSHTVDPETDNVEVLQKFANRLGVQNGRWYFLTGNKKQLYQMAREGYLLDAGEGNGDSSDFIHTQNFALIDKEFHLRGFYDGTDSTDIDRLIREIRLLKQEYDHSK